MTATKKGFSSKEIQKQLGIKRYEPVWAMVHKLRKATGNRDASYTLEGMIEMDEGYFTIESSELEKSRENWLVVTGILDYDIKWKFKSGNSIYITCKNTQFFLLIN